MRADWGMLVRPFGDERIGAPMKARVAIALTVMAVLTPILAFTQSKPAVDLPLSPRGLAAIQVGGSWTTANGESNYTNGSWITVDYGRPILRGLEELECRDGGTVEDHGVSRDEALDAGKVGEAFPLRVPEVCKGRPGRLDAGSEGAEAEGLQARDLEVGGQALLRRPGREPGGLDACQRDAEVGECPGQERVSAVGDEDLGWPPEQRRLQQGLPRALLLPYPEIPCGDVRERHAQAPRAPVHGEEEVVRGPVEVLRVRHRAWSDHAHHFAAHQFLALDRRLHLLAHRHLLSSADEAANVAIGGVVRDAGHGDVLARSERDLQESRPEVGVLEEHLVEVPEAEEQQVLRVAALQLPVLPHHRRELGSALRHERSAADRRS